MGRRGHRLLALEPDPRNRTLLRLTYAGGLLVSELVALRWRDLQPRGDSGQLAVFGDFGKGGKSRSVLRPASVWADFRALRTTGDSGYSCLPRTAFDNPANASPLTTVSTLGGERVVEGLLESVAAPPERPDVHPPRGPGRRVRIGVEP